VTELLPGDVVDLQLGQVVPADLRLLAVAGLECDESVLTGESLPTEKSAEPVAVGTPLAELRCCALMGTVVRAGSGTGVVVATGGDAEFGRIAVGLGEQQPETEFQAGLRKFSMLLVQVAGVLTGAIFIINVALHKPVIDALLSRWRSRPGSPRSCSRRSSRPAWPPGPGSWPSARSWSSGWSASMIWATSTCCSPTRPAR
jgi:Mg2+-importing ATPase